jgi:DNA (cytosine-5)-methyltransferase 1
MRHGSLFSGIGGFDLASEWMGWENVFHCEWMEFPRKVLDYYWPNADSHIDICKTDFKKYANTIDILTGGFPCQPFSTAGKRKGTEDERYLWGEMLRAIQEIKPKYVIAENVFGITNIDGGMVFEQVCLDLEAEGYEVQPFIIPAAAKNAPHRRDRVWFIAYSYCRGTQARKERTILGESNRQRKTGRFIDDDVQRDATDTSSGRIQRYRGSSEKWKFQTNEFNENYSERQPRMEWQKFPLEPPICSGDDGISHQLDGITFSKWRAESIKGYGNAIVPQVAYEIFKTL